MSDASTGTLLSSIHSGHRHLLARPGLVLGIERKSAHPASQQTLLQSWTQIANRLSQFRVTGKTVLCVQGLEAGLRTGRLTTFWGIGQAGPRAGRPGVF